MNKKFKTAKVKSYRIAIVELDASMPRRNPKKPHLYIGMTSEDVTTRLSQLKNGHGPSYALGHFVSVFANEPYAKPTKDLKVAKRRLDETVEKYFQLGHAVNNKVREWRVYVIDLKQGHLLTQPEQGHVYVGSTSKSIEERTREHEQGATSKKGHPLNSRYVTKHFDRLNKSLSLKQVFLSKESAERREEGYSEELCRRGYLVRSGQFTPDPKTCISKRRQQSKGGKNG